MSLRESTVRATVAVTDIGRAAGFYETKLGLTPMEGGPEMVRIYECGGGSLLQVYESEHAGGNDATVASWSVTTGDYEALVEDLIAKGLTFERPDELRSDSKGIHTFGEHRVAWCRDPDGNTLAIDNGGAV